MISSGIFDSSCIIDYVVSKKTNKTRMVFLFKDNPMLSYCINKSGFEMSYWHDG